jgi:hypothetical protein
MKFSRALYVMSTVLILTELEANDYLNEMNITKNSNMDIVARVIRIPFY